MPSAALIPELLAAYPKAKVIVVERDADAWYRSVQNTFLGTEKSVWQPREPPQLTPLHRMLRHSQVSHFCDTDAGRTVLRLDRELFGHVGPLIAMDEKYGGDLRDEARAKADYRAKYAEVRRLVPEGARRLEYRLGDGWAPLCTFLGKDVPDTEFPAVNESKIWVQGSQYQLACAWQRVRRRIAQWVGIGGAIGLGTWLFWHRMMQG